MTALQLLRVCTHGAKGNPIACEYSTGGNFLHAVLQYRPQVRGCNGCCCAKRQHRGVHCAQPPT